MIPWIKISYVPTTTWVHFCFYSWNVCPPRCKQMDRKKRKEKKKNDTEMMGEMVSFGLSLKGKDKNINLHQESILVSELLQLTVNIWTPSSRNNCLMVANNIYIYIIMFSLSWLQLVSSRLCNLNHCCVKRIFFARQIIISSFIKEAECDSSIFFLSINCLTFGEVPCLLIEALQELISFVMLEVINRSHLRLQQWANRIIRQMR